MLKCSVPFCKGNYSSAYRVSVFSFPKDPDLLFRWLYAIKRANFVPTHSSRVCEVHFLEEDFEYEVSAYDAKNDRLLTAPLKYKRLKKCAIPTIFPNYPSHFQPILPDPTSDSSTEQLDSSTTSSQSRRKRRKTFKMY